MNKEDILKKSREEYKINDERDKKIETEAYSNAYLAIIGVNAILILILFFQKLFTGKAFADYRVFFLALLIGMCARSYTNYKYNKKKTDLYSFILSLLASILTLITIIMSGMNIF